MRREARDGESTRRHQQRESARQREQRMRREAIDGESARRHQERESSRQREQQVQREARDQDSQFRVHEAETRRRELNEARELSRALSRVQAERELDESFDDMQRSRAVIRPTVTAPGELPIMVKARNLTNSNNIDPPAPILEMEYARIQARKDVFPETPSAENIRSSMLNYKEHISDDAQREACCCCGIRVKEGDIERMHKNDPQLVKFKRKYPAWTVDACGVQGNEYMFCEKCDRDIRSSQRVPKFSSLNYVNSTSCENYPEQLKGLTFVEEAMIARAHVVGIFLKLSPGKRGNLPDHRGSRGHFVSVKQDPSALLNILPCQSLREHTSITVTWEGSAPPTKEVLAKFCTVRREKVFEALRWLVEHNPCYKKVTIDHNVINSWPNTPFVPDDIHRLANFNSTGYASSSSREGYASTLEEGFYQNELDSQLGDVDPGTVVSTSFFSDGHGRQLDSTPALFAQLDVAHQKIRAEVLAEEIEGARDGGVGVAEPEDFASSDEEEVYERQIQHPEQSVPNVRYRAHKGLRPKNSYVDSDYFPSAFPTLFPFGIGGHLGDQKIGRQVPVSLRAFAKWAMLHHSRRYVPDLSSNIFLSV